MQLEKHLSRFGREQLLAYSRLKGLEPDANASAEELASLICSALDGEITPLQRVSRLEVEVYASDIEKRLSEWVKEKQVLLESIRQNENDAMSALHKGEMYIHQTAIEATKTFDQISARCRDYVQTAVEQARTASSDATNELSKAREVLGKQETLFKFLQVIIGLVIGTAGFLTILNALSIKEQVVAVQKLMQDAHSVEQTAKQTASNLANTDSGLRKLELLTLADRSQQIAERISTKMSPEDIHEVENQIAHVEPLLVSLTIAVQSPQASEDGSMNLFLRLNQFLTNASQTVPMANSGWSDTDQSTLAALDRALRAWESMPSDYTNSPPLFRDALKSLAAYRENMIGIAKYLKGRKTGNQQLMDQGVSHFSKAAEIDSDFARPNNSLGTSFGRLMLDELTGAGPSGKFLDYYKSATNFYAKSYEQAREPRIRVLILNNLATSHFKLAWFYIEQSKDTEAKNAYRQCQLTISRAKRYGVPNSSLLETEAEALGIEAHLDKQSLVSLKKRILDLLEEVKANGLGTEKPEYYLAKTPLKFVKAVDPDFEQSITNLLK